MMVSYKNELANKISNHYKSIMVAAEEINVVWREIQTYFSDLHLSLAKVIGLLGNHGRCIDVDDSTTSTEIIDEINANTEWMNIAYRKGIRYVEEFN